MGQENTIKRVVSVVIIVFSLFTGFYGLTKYFTTREVFDISCAGTDKALKGIQKNIAVQRAQDQYIFLQNQENGLRMTQMLMKTQSEKENIQRLIDNIMKQKMDAQKRMLDLQR